MAYAAATVMICAFVVGACFLALHGHVILAGICLLCAGGVSVKGGDDE